jgi:hypothetical protein
MVRGKEPITVKVHWAVLEGPVDGTIRTTNHVLRVPESKKAPTSASSLFGQMINCPAGKYSKERVRRLGVISRASCLCYSLLKERAHSSAHSRS